MIGGLCRLRHSAGIAQKCIRYSRIIDSHITSRCFQGYSGRLDGSVDGMAQSRVAFEEVKVTDIKEVLQDEKFLIRDSTDEGFVVNKAFIVGPILVLPDIGFFSWKVNSIEDADERSVFLLSRILPKVDILLVGVGPYSTQPSPSFMAACKQHGIGLEVQTTPQAVQTYQILLQDKRNFASLMIPSSRKTLGSYERKLLEDSKKNLVRRSPGNKKGLRKT